MPTPVTRDQVVDLIARGAQLVDVLRPHEYEELHLQGALSIPLKRLDKETTSVLTRGKPVVVY